METKKPFDRVLWSGIIAIAVSAIVYLCPQLTGNVIRRDSFMGIFMLNYCITIYYFMVLAFTKFKKRTGFAHTRNDYALLFCVLMLISAFSLNKSEFSIFEKSAPWLSAYLTIECVAIVSFFFRDRFPRAIRYLLYFVLAAGLPIYLYFAVYLSGFYVICLVGGIFLGISLHVLAPLVLIINVSLTLIKVYKEEKRSLWFTVAGSSLPIVFAAIYVSMWHNLNTRINYILNEDQLNETSLPAWARLGQRIPRNDLTEKILKSSLVYTGPFDFSKGWNMPHHSYEEARKHDPLVTLAVSLNDKNPLNVDERIKLLETLYNGRHKSEERFWRGSNLTVNNVVNHVRIYPEYRIAYTEKIMCIKNNAISGQWPDREEAIFTFHLPEGGIVTSLSLWINGQEHQSVLTTKGKADTAYKTIVGVENRDPSLVRWQEGNTVLVRIFPCTNDEIRKFKIGITAPLAISDNILSYSDIKYEGPQADGATESSRVEFDESVKNLKIPDGYVDAGGHAYNYMGNYIDKQTWAFTPPALSSQPFSFDGKSYIIKAYEKQYLPFKADSVFLDLNMEWTPDELHTVWDAVKDKKVFVYDRHLAQVNSNNVDSLYNIMKHYNYSLFPFYKIINNNNVLVISKSPANAPTLMDIRDSKFGERLTTYLEGAGKIRFYNIGANLTPYLKTLRELRAFFYDAGTAQDVAKLLKENKFIKEGENDTCVVINDAQICIRQGTDTPASKASDHLMRLFAYNRIMQKIGAHYFTDNYVSNDLIASAQKAYVVTPLTGLIVLETQADYDRFGIKNANNSLNNASVHGSGAAPEPGEWVLILLASTIMVYMLFSQKLKGKLHF